MMYFGRMFTLVNISLFILSSAIESRHCTQADSCWPDAGAWADLESELGEGVLNVIADVDTVHQECAAVFSDSPAPAVELKQAANGTCFFGIGCVYDGCTEGQLPSRIPVYSVGATTVEHVQAAVRFAAENRIKLSIKSTGADYSTSNQQPDSILIWMSNFEKYSLEGVNEAFVDTCGTEYDAVLKAGGGEVWGDVFNALATDGRYVASSGAALTVGSSGGWLQGGGLGPLDRDLGLGVDNVVQFEVVLADGSLATVDACSEPDLFWALRGGGGGNWGVVVSQTSIVHPVKPFVRMEIGWLASAAVGYLYQGIPIGTTFPAYTNRFDNNAPLYWTKTEIAESYGESDTISMFHDAMRTVLNPSTMDSRLDAFFAFGCTWSGGFVCADLYFRGSIAEMEEEILPAIREAFGIDSIQGNGAVGDAFLYTLGEYTSFYDYANSDCRLAAPGSAEEYVCINLGYPTSNGYNIDAGLGSTGGYQTRIAWTVPQSLFNDDDLWSQLLGDPFTYAMQGHVLGGKTSTIAADSTSINPAVRDAGFQFQIMEDTFNSYGGISALLEFVDTYMPYPENSPCFNHDGFNQEWFALLEERYQSDYMQLYWGSNLPRLQRIKAHYDPNNVFTCRDCITPADTSEESSDSECSNDDTLAGALVAGASDMNINDCDSLKRWGELNFGEMFACDTFVTTITEFGMLNTEVEVAGTLTDICCEACTDTMACTLDVDSYQPESGECEEGEESFAFCEMTQCISNSDCTYDDFGLDNPDDEHICPTDLTEHEFLYQDDDGNEMVGYLIFPSDMDTSMLHPGVVVYGGFTGDGGQRMEREYAREYARKGMVAFLPDYFPGRHDQDDFDQVLDAAIQYSTLFQDGVRAQRLAMLAYEQLTSLPYVDSDRVGAFGFCFGGAMAMQAARAGANWKVAAGLHAEYPPMTEYIGDSWDMEYFAEFAGDSDPFIPPDHIEGWNEELSNSGSDYEVTMIENGLHGFAMKYSLASYQVLATFGGQSQDDIIYDEEGTAIGITGTFLYVEEQRDLAFNRIEELFEEYGLFTGGVAAEESTEGPSTCGCGEEIGTAFSNLESELQTQMAALMSETLPAQLDALLSVTLTEQIQLALAAALPERFVTAEDFAMLEDKVGDLEMDNNDVMNGMSDMATCMADIAGSMGGGGDDSYEMTDAPAETAAPTEYWQTIGRLLEGGNNKCSTSDNDRAFRLSFTSLENCLTRCRDDDRCQFASTNFMSESSTKYCIGCINLTQAADGWMAYEMLNDRRQLSNVKQLSEIERLRAENQRLRAELAEARRN